MLLRKLRKGSYFFIIFEPSEQSITVPSLSVLYIDTLFSFKRLTVPSFGWLYVLSLPTEITAIDGFILLRKSLVVEVDEP